MKGKRCPYYEDLPVKSCNAVTEGIKVPTKREIERFCLGDYDGCPIYINREKEVMGVRKGEESPG